MRPAKQSRTNGLPICEPSETNTLSAIASGIARKRVVGDERAHAVRAHHVGLVGDHLRRAGACAGARAGRSPRPTARSCRRSSAPGPGTSSSAARPREGVADAVQDRRSPSASASAAPYVRRFSGAWSKRSSYCEEVDRDLHLRIPAADVACDGVGPAGLERTVRVAVADAVNAKNGNLASHDHFLLIESLSARTPCTPDAS